MSDPANPWTTLTEKIMYENPWVRVEEHEVINPTGNPGIYGKIHFKNIAVAVLPLDDQGYTWLVGQYRYPLDSYEWEIPEGGCKEGESTLAAAQRELAEETGLRATRFENILEMQLSNSVSDEVSVSYLATGLTEGTAYPEEDEKIQIRKVPFHEAVEMVKKGEIRDALSVATILKAALGM
jgi:8-oxo-dGTP pyrophosphatase MutT (NUDIX family)